MQALVEELNSRREAGGAIEVDIFTSQPNRYASLSTEAPANEDHGWLRIHRIPIASHKGGMKDQALAYLHYARGVHKLSAAGRWDIVVATSSRLMTAALGAHVARKIRAPLYLDIRDLFTDNMREMLAKSPLRILTPVFRWIEKRTFRQASRINLVSQGFLPHIRTVAPSVPVSVLTNGIDRTFLTDTFEKKGAKAELPLILYAGNMGEGQGLHLIVPEAAKRLEGVAQFRLIGDGGKRTALVDALSADAVKNVELCSPIPRRELSEQYRQADFLLMHLNDLDAFRRVLPSKVFEYGATGKPILAGVAGYAAEFCRMNLPDAFVFNPLDANGLVQSVKQAISDPVHIDRELFRETYARERITRQLVEDILATTYI